MPISNQFTIHFSDNSPVQFNESNMLIRHEDSAQRTRIKLQFILKNFLMNDIVFAFDASRYWEDNFQDRAAKQYAVAAAFYLMKEEILPLTESEEKIKLRYIYQTTPHYLEELL